MISKDKLNLRHSRFIYNYISNGFNATKAYMDSYKTENRNVAGVEGHRLLSNPKCLKLLCAELAKLDLDINEQYVVQKVLEIVNDPKCKKGDVLRALELVSRMKGYLKPDISNSVAVFQGLQAKEEAIISKRLSGNDTQVVDSKVVIDDDKLT